MNALPIRTVRAYRADYSESISAFYAEKKMNKNLQAVKSTTVQRTPEFVSIHCK